MAEDLDELLAVRYGELFRTYGVGEIGPLIRTKNQIVVRMEQHPGLLRADAAHFLIVSLDQMIIRPCVGTVFDPDGKVLPLFQYESFVRLEEDLEKVTSMILDTLSTKQLPTSSHDVMRAIEENWEEINKVFLWA